MNAKIWACALLAAATAACGVSPGSSGPGTGNGGSGGGTNAPLSVTVIVEGVPADLPVIDDAEVVINDVPRGSLRDYRGQPTTVTASDLVPASEWHPESGVDVRLDLPGYKAAYAIVAEDALRQANGGAVTTDIVVAADLTGAWTTCTATPYRDGVQTGPVEAWAEAAEMMWRDGVFGVAFDHFGFGLVGLTISGDDSQASLHGAVASDLASLDWEQVSKAIPGAVVKGHCSR